MTGQEMVTQFNLSYGQDISPDVFGLETSEVLSFLNQAKDDIVRDLYLSGNLTLLGNILEKGKGFSQDTTGTGISNSVYYNTSSINDSFLYYVASRIKVTKTFPPMTLEWVPCDLIPAVSTEYIETAYHKPMFQHCKVMKTQLGNNLAFLVVYDAFTTAVDDFTLDYIKVPDTITSSPVEYQLDVSLHQDIVSKAVTLALETMQQERIKTQPVIEGGGNTLTVNRV